MRWNPVRMFQKQGDAAQIFLCNHYTTPTYNRSDEKYWHDDESTLPPLVFGFASKKKKIYFENLKKKSYEPRHNLLQSQTSKNLLRKWSRFCKNIL
jgi:hypothetical protein